MVSASFGVQQCLVLIHGKEGLTAPRWPWMTPPSIVPSFQDRLRSVPGIRGVQERGMGLLGGTALQ